MIAAEQSTAKTLMDEGIKSVSPEMNVEDCIQFLINNSLPNAPVVAEGKLVGFISEADCLSYLSNEIYFSMPDVKVENLMKSHPLCVKEDTDLFTIASLFTSNGFRKIPVVEGLKLVGMVDRNKTLKFLHDYHQAIKKEGKSKKDRPNLKELVNHRFIIQNK